MFHRIAMLILGILAVQVGYAADADTSSGSGEPASAQTQQPAQGSVQGHGSISIAYLGSYADGFWIASNTKLPLGRVHSRGIELDASYNVSNSWSVYGGIRYIDNRYSGTMPDCPTSAPPQCAGTPPLNPQHPETPFLDDGNYHGNWQDYTLGAAWHANIGNYYITPSVTATIPSHAYPIYGNVYVGQHLHQLLFDVTLSHQFDFTNFYYKLGYGYAFSQRVLGYDTGYQRYDGELGWFVDEKFSVRAFLTGRRGNGVSARDLLPLTDGLTNDLWYRRNQISQHSYNAYGLGFDYGLGDRYTASVSIQREYWGDTVFDYKYAVEARLTRSF